MTQNAQSEKILNVIAEEVGVPRDEIEGETEFADLGVDDFLAKSILARIARETQVRLPSTTFDECTTVDSLKSSLLKTLNQPTQPNGVKKSPSQPCNPLNPLSVILQGKPASARKTIFLLPDGSGSAMAYAKLPPIDPNICVIAMNSPYFHRSGDHVFTVPGIAETWAEEIRRRQQKGSYILGGWSAGGYYSFEVAKHLQRAGGDVEKLILIDSPCRLIYEELPMEVVHYLSSNDLMGNWGGKQPPKWMIDHFQISIQAISRYVPEPMEAVRMPEVFLIWAADGVLKGVEPADTGLEFDVRITRMLMYRKAPDDGGPLGWDALFPGSSVSVAKMPGNHFTIVYPPNVSWDYQLSSETLC